MQLSKPIGEVDNSKNRYIVSYVVDSYHAFITVSAKFKSDYYIIESIGYRGYNGRHWRNKDAPDSIISFENIDRGQGTLTFYAEHYYIDKKSLHILREQLDKFLIRSRTSSSISETMQKQSQFQDFNLLRRNCHNFACYLLCAIGIIDDKLLNMSTLLKPLEFIGGYLPHWGDKYTLARITSGKSFELLSMINQRNGHSFTARGSSDGLLSALSALSSSSSTSHSNAGQRCFFKWPKEIKINDQLSYTPDASFFRITEAIHPGTNSDLRYLKAKNLIESYNSDAQFYNYRRNYTTEVADIAKELSAMEIEDDDLTVMDILEVIYEKLNNKSFLPLMNGALMARVQFIEFLLNQTNGVQVEYSERKPFQHVNSQIERQLFNLSQSYFTTTNKKFLLYQAYIWNKDIETKKKLFSDAMAAW
ncbi:MAG: hypothetical protein GY750_00390 [Lentisphaerae bacterium]|nr:hypothetical protein [Lentisphaerota bacterium]MCP4099878.1 hypothetical protein [Lentisphaerota bacterium]